MKYIKAFAKFVYPFIKIQLLLLVFIIISTAISLAPPYALKVLIDNCIPNKDLDLLYKIGEILLLVYLARSGINHLNAHYSTLIYNKIGDNIRRTLFNNMILQPYEYFENNTQGNLVQKINFEVSKIQSFLSNVMISFINNLFLVVGVSFMLAITNKLLFLLYLSVFPIPFLINLFFNKKIKKLIKESSILEGDLFNFYIDKIKNISLIKSYNSISIENERLKEQLSTIFSNIKSRSVFGSLSGNLSGLFISIGPLLILMVGGYQAILGNLTIGAVVAFIQYSNRLTPPLNGIIGIHLEYSQVLISMKHIYPLLVLKEEDKNELGKSSLFIKNIVKIDINKLTFVRDEKPVIKDLCFKFEQGTSYAIVGENGSGKSTLLKILCGFYTPTEGTILVNNEHSLSDLNDNSWLDNIAVVFQEPLILNDSILSNISYGSIVPVIEKVWDALDTVGLANFVKNLPNGLLTIYGDGENELKMSGGQRQLLALARALYRDRSVLILDEATSAVDTKNEEQILIKIKEKYKNKIVIFVSHRLSTIKNLDRIGVMANGLILEEGKHADLLSNTSHYRSIFQSQF
ncbi:ABC transporter ATP-binding protein [Pedobacter sp. MR2016-19]|uniref:ABC transporter ATP-binding protein n=1 Tax=Pedobacter sp. MR2016-19 TaxID=2780089 RepID=UPI001874053F|nr:ABC transporter ATP-binding protein [Pedobacter sp. MR2016-19]MBE5317745.1 ABC transporter ATP-binding protein [Pedobacter sp. MR2016-19]